MGKITEWVFYKDHNQMDNKTREGCSLVIGNANPKPE